MLASRHSCIKPITPISFDNEWDVSNFKLQVTLYQNCIEDYVEKQKREIETHQQALSDAIKEWNDFVNFELQ